MNIGRSLLCSLIEVTVIIQFYQQTKIQQAIRSTVVTISGNQVFSLFQGRYHFFRCSTYADLLNFTCGPVDLNLTFTATLFMDNLDLMARPVNYISYEVISNDGQAHQVEHRQKSAVQSD